MFLVDFTLTTPTPERQKIANRILNLNDQLSSFETTVQSSNSRLLEGLNLETTPLSLKTSSFLNDNTTNPINRHNFYRNFNDTTLSHKLKFSTPTFDSYRKFNAFESRINKNKLNKKDKTKNRNIINNNNNNNFNTKNNSNGNNSNGNRNISSGKNSKPQVSFPSPIKVSPLKIDTIQTSALSGVSGVSGLTGVTAASPTSPLASARSIKSIKSMKSQSCRTPTVLNQERIDFSSNIWHEVNTMLSQCGFHILMKSGDSEGMPPQMIICNRFIHVLTEYKHLKNKSNDYEKQLMLLNDKLKDYKLEITQLKHISKTNENSNEMKYIHLQRQYAESQKILLSKDSEITKLKNKIEKFIENDNKRKENVNLIYQSLNLTNKSKNKLNSNKNKSYNSQIMDIISVFDNQRKKLTQENKLLKQEMRKLRQSSQNHKHYNNNNHNNEYQLSSNVSICQSNRESDNEDDSNSNTNINTNNNKASRNVRKPFTFGQNMHHIDGISDGERTRNLHKIETRRLMDKIDLLETEVDNYKIKFEDATDENSRLRKDLETRPSQTEWIRLRKTLNKMNKDLKSAQSAADLRQYMETRELIKRDKEIFNLKLHKIENIPHQILKEIVTDICRVLSIQDVTSVVKTISNMAKVVESVPVLEQFITRVVRLMIASDHCVNLIKIRRISPKQVFNHVIPTLQEWIINLDKVKTLENFKMTINNILMKRTVGQSAAVTAIKDAALNDGAGGDDGAAQGKMTTSLPLHDMTRQVRELIESEEFLLNAKETFVNLETRMNDRNNPPTMEQKIIKHFMKLFEISNVNGIFAKMNSIYIELNEMKNFINTLKSMLNIEKTANVNSCFNALQNLINISNGNEINNNNNNNNKNILGGGHNSKVNNEKGDREEIFLKWNEIMLELTKVLQCHETELIATVKELNERCVEYDAVFPRVQNLVNQLRSALGVQHAHQILPKVRQLCAATGGIPGIEANS